MSKSDEEEILEITAGVSELSIVVNGDSNHVCINADARTSASSTRRPSPAAGGKEASKAAPKRAAARGSGSRVRFYVIAVCPGRPEAIGIWHTTWRRVCEEIPGGQLYGSTAMPCKGVDTLEEAIAIWNKWRPSETHVVRPP